MPPHSRTSKEPPLDAYIFATSATQGAISTLIGGVGSTGPARVVLPTSGDRALYVAVSANDETTLNSRISAVLATQVLSGTSTHVATSSPATFPTHAAVDDYLGLSVLSGADPSSIASTASGITGVIGVAVTNGGTVRVLVESTASSTGALSTIMDDVAAISGVTVQFEATGETANGAGF